MGDATEGVANVAVKELMGGVGGRGGVKVEELNRTLISHKNKTGHMFATKLEQSCQNTQVEDRRSSQ